MSIELSDEQREFQDSLARFLGDTVTSEYRRERIESAECQDPKFSDALAELGLSAVFGEVDPDFALGFRELGLIAFEEGRALVPEKIAEPILAGPFLVSRLMDQQSLPGLSDKDRSLLRSGEGRVAIVPVAALPKDLQSEHGVDVVSGALSFVESAGRCEFLLLQFGRKRWGLVKRPKRGFDLKTEDTLDLSLHFQKVELEEVPVCKIPQDVSQTLSELFELTRALEMAGLCSKVIDMTVDYVKTRKQFGVPVGGFQAVQQQLVDAYLQTEALRALAFFGSWTFDHSREQFSFSAQSAALKATSVAPMVVEKSIQLHGGIGFTWEYDLHLYLRRARMFQLLHKFSSSQSEELLQAVN